MKNLIGGVAIMLTLLPAITSAADTFDCRVRSQFSSQGSIGKSVRDAIDRSKERLTIALYGFDNFDLGTELLDLAKRKVAVRLKIDSARSAGKKTAKLIAQLRAGGVEVQTVAPDGRNHNKFAVIDGKRILTGSYNWTLKAESNWENLLILDCPELAEAYEREWERIH
jgi:phosphatidylserine/phosphatidylglycerophosphate/cardiolipin synthase-like enzyme